MTSDDDVLSGAELEQLMDCLEADLEECGSAEEIDLLARLRARPLRADSMDSIDRLHTLWMIADDPAAARAVVNDDGAALLQAARPDEQAEIRMLLTLQRLHIAEYLEEEDTVCSELSQMRDIVTENSSLDVSQYGQLRIFDRMEGGSLDIALEAAALLHAFDLAMEDRAACRAWDEANHQIRRALAFTRHGRDDEAHVAAIAAMATLQAAPPGQNVDANDWLRLGDSLIEIVPEQLDAFRQKVVAMTAGEPLPQRREAEIRLARFAARALYAQGDLPGALDACAAARYSLSSDGGDDFIEFELPWLIEGSRVEEAGRRVFFHIYQLEDRMWDGAARLVHERLTDGSDQSVWWPLCVMCACNTVETLACLLSAVPENEDGLTRASAVHDAIFGGIGQLEMEEDMQPVFSAACVLAERRSPHHPWIRRLAAVHDATTGFVDAASQVDQLVAAAKEGSMEDNWTAYNLFIARSWSVGLIKTLKLSPPSLSSGLWSYSFVVTIKDFIEEELENLSPKQQSEGRKLLATLKRACYEHGLACMERYFETGNGHPYDACAHLYSMLCNNLAVIYADTDTRYQDAIELHLRGIAASPFAEHYEGILHARIRMGDPEGTIDAAEQLWHFSAEYGFHNLRQYIASVEQALQKLGRGLDISVWHERLAM